MLKYITAEEYKELLGVNNVPDNFENMNIEASSYINRQTQGRINVNNIPEKVKYTTCLIINLLKEKEKKINEIGNLKSENIEGWSETYMSPEEVKQDYAKRMYNTLVDYLWDVIGTDGRPLLYKGVPTV